MKTLKECINAMKKTDQIEGKQTVLQHGYQVFKFAVNLINHLEKGTPLYSNFKVPSWVYDNKSIILKELVDYKNLKHYCIFHDIGKPFCITDN